MADLFLMVSPTEHGERKSPLKTASVAGSQSTERTAEEEEAVSTTSVIIVGTEGMKKSLSLPLC